MDRGRGDKHSQGKCAQSVLHNRVSDGVEGTVPVAQEGGRKGRQWKEERARLSSPSWYCSAALEALLVLDGWYNPGRALGVQYQAA